MKLADRLAQIQPSATLALSAKAKQLRAAGKDVVDFSVGEPDLDTPEVAKAAGVRAIQEGFTKYTASSGIDELKAAIVEKLRRENGLEYQKNEIIVSCGAKHTLYNIAQACYNPREEVLIPAPYWVSYPDQVRLAGATPIFIPTREEDDWALTAEAVAQRITPRSRALILNSPCNPTGSAYDRATLAAIGRLAVERNLLVISDEIYEHFSYDGFKPVSFPSLGPDVRARTILVNGVSKAFSMTGWRIGYAAGPKEIVAAMDAIQSQSTSNPASMAQKAAVAALREGRDFTDGMVAEFDRRRRYVVDRLNKIPGVTCRTPRGAFYAFPNVSGLFARKLGGRPLGSAAAVAAHLLEAALVVVVPGEPFGAPAHLRLSYAAALETLKKGLDRIEAAVTRLD
jgi:aspartate aminotransferase